MPNHSALALDDLPLWAYPVTLEVYELDAPKDSKPKWHKVVKKPSTVHVPGFNRSMRVCVLYGDGTEFIMPPWPSL